MVNPAGTGRPALVISARPAPLPPSVSFMDRSPSALPLPKKYTNFLGPLAAGAALDFATLVFAGLDFATLAFAFAGLAFAACARFVVALADFFTLFCFAMCALYSCLSASGTISETSASRKIWNSSAFIRNNRACRNLRSSVITITSSKNFATVGPYSAADANASR